LICRSEPVEFYGTMSVYGLMGNRYADLFMNLWNREYIKGFDAMNQWTRQFIDYPQAAFTQFMRDFMRKNKLVRGKMQFRGKTADLSQVKSSLLAIGGKTDQISTPAAVRVAMRAVGSQDKQLLLAPGGHMGVLAGSTAPEHVWTPTAKWLAQRSELLPFSKKSKKSKIPNTPISKQKKQVANRRSTKY